jgi:hypothetical protein
MLASFLSSESRVCLEAQHVQCHGLISTCEMASDGNRYEGTAPKMLCISTIILPRAEAGNSIRQYPKDLLFVGVFPL